MAKELLAQINLLCTGDWDAVRDMMMIVDPAAAGIITTLHPSAPPAQPTPANNVVKLSKASQHWAHPLITGLKTAQQAWDVYDSSPNNGYGPLRLLEARGTKWREGPLRQRWHDFMKIITLIQFHALETGISPGCAAASLTALQQGRPDCDTCSKLVEHLDWPPDAAARLDVYRRTGQYPGVAPASKARRAQCSEAAEGFAVTPHPAGVLQPTDSRIEEADGSADNPTAPAGGPQQPAFDGQSAHAGTNLQGELDMTTPPFAQPTPAAFLPPTVAMAPFPAAIPPLDAPTHITAAIPPADLWQPVLDMPLPTSTHPAEAMPPADQAQSAVGMPSATFMHPTAAMTPAGLWQATVAMPPPTTTQPAEAMPPAVSTQHAGLTAMLEGFPTPIREQLLLALTGPNKRQARPLPLVGADQLLRQLADQTLGGGSALSPLQAWGCPSRSGVTGTLLQALGGPSRLASHLAGLPLPAHHYPAVTHAALLPSHTASSQPVPIQAAQAALAAGHIPKATKNSFMAFSEWYYKNRQPGDNSKPALAWAALGTDGKAEWAKRAREVNVAEGRINSKQVKKLKKSQ